MLAVMRGRPKNADSTNVEHPTITDARRCKMADILNACETAREPGTPLLDIRDASPSELVGYAALAVESDDEQSACLIRARFFDRYKHESSGYLGDLDASD